MAGRVTWSPVTVSVTAKSGSAWTRSSRLARPGCGVLVVVDASVLAPVVADGGTDGRRFRHRLNGETVAGPDLLRIEVTSVLRRHANSGRLKQAQAEAAIRDLLEFPITVFPTSALLGRVWELRQNVTAYDGCYVALAEAIDCRLLTADHRLANAPGLRCEVELL